MRRILIWLAVIAIVFALAFMFGPRVRVDTRIAFDVSKIGDDLEVYLEAAEDKVAALRPGMHKEIVWADRDTKVRTPLAVVYVHGFSASKGEIRPLPDEVAKRLGANLLFTRLKGHGQDGAAMATASVNDWINDYAEAVAIGSRLGERVIVIATSTGAALATLAATNEELTGHVAGMVLISPNYGVKGTGAWLLTQPWGRHIAELVIGPERGFTPQNQLSATYWTSRYPTAALLPMAALTLAARRAPVETIKVPALFVFSDNDQVVRPDLTRKVAQRWGALHEIVRVEDSDDPQHHVIAGDALSPSTTGRLTGAIVNWVRKTAG
ncbi:alpha/beta hydrolase [Arvimicrobium flavum]|uniref:alpha/beta hydrolase n=1 Tax=Arvimicrobium flavum TaxID=3393320 RepID=UPI0030840D1F